MRLARRAWLIAVLVGVIPATHAADPEPAETPPPADDEFLEFLGSVDAESADEDWLDFLSRTEIEKVNPKAPKKPPDTEAKK